MEGPTAQTSLVERIARRTQALLERELGEDPRLDVLGGLRVASQLSLPLPAEPSEDRPVKLEARTAGFSLQAGRHFTSTTGRASRLFAGTYCAHQWRKTG